MIPAEKATKNVAQEEINPHLCSATSIHRHCKRAGQRIIESIGSSIIIRSYILDMCWCSNLGLYRAAFFIHSSNRYTKMKQPKSAAGINIPASVKAGTIFSWATVARMLNALPMGVCECRTEEDAKSYVKAFILILSAFILAGMYDSVLLQEGGAL